MLYLKQTTLCIFLLYLFLLYRGVAYLHYNLNAVLIAALIIIFCFLYNQSYFTRSSLPKIESSDWSKREIIISFGIFCFAILLPYVSHTFIANPLPTANSDVILQMQVQFERFARGEQPYAPVTEFSWNPFPVYMPMQWLPIGIGKFFDFDIRWSGFYIFFPIYLYFLYHHSKNTTYKIWSPLLVVLPLLFIFLSYLYRQEDLNSVFDIVVYAYYFLLGIGIVKLNHKIIFIGLVGAMLSRYTAVFWLPMFLFIIKEKFGNKVFYNYVLYGFLAFLILFVLPFLVRDTSIIGKGLAYHNLCGIIDWEKISVKGEIPFTISLGSSYIQFWTKIIHGSSPSESIFILRTIQLITMIILNVLFYIFYKKHQSAILNSPSAFLLTTMVLIMLFFYLTSALVFSHYWFTITPILCIMVLYQFEKQHT